MILDIRLVRLRTGRIRVLVEGQPVEISDTSDPAVAMVWVSEFLRVRSWIWGEASAFVTDETREAR